MAIISCDSDRRDELIKGLTDSFAEWRGKAGTPLSISMGYVSSDEDPEMTLEDMRKEAEKRMYLCKSEYYRREGKDRRGRLSV